MVIKTKKGMYLIQRNYREAFEEVAFEEKYIEECMDKYEYIVGDISSSILRLKGFDTNVKSKNYFGYIDDYLHGSCALGCPYYILKRIKTEDEFEKLKNYKEEEYENFEIHSLEKENFDKDSLVLESTPKDKPRIVIDMKKVNALPKGTLSSDLAEFVKQDKGNGQASKNSTPVKQEEVQTYVSASPDFDPSKSASNRFNRNTNKGNKSSKSNSSNTNVNQKTAAQPNENKNQYNHNQNGKQENNNIQNNNPNKNKNRNRNHNNKNVNKNK